MNVFISGGCKNGKSMYAQKRAFDLAKDQGLPLYYLATMKTKDAEDRARVARHRQERAGWGFETIECEKDICSALEKEGVDPKGVFLLDSVTALLENEMFGEDFVMDEEAGPRTAQDLIQFARRTGNTIFVSDFIYGDAMTYDGTTGKYMEGLATCDRVLAQVCQEVIEVSVGNPIHYKG